MRLNILTLTVVVISALLLSACGGGGGGDASFSNGTTIVQVDVNCTGATVAAIATYISLNSGDTVVKNDNNTSIKIYHDVNGTKKVCLVSGSAHIVR
jgi:ABC-type methionine transport system permease subunit